MNSLACDRGRMQWRPRFVLETAVVLLCGSACLGAEKSETAAGPKEPGRKLFCVPTVKWLPDPVPVAGARAKTEAEMKPYTEVIPGSDVKFDVVPIAGGKFLMGSPQGEKDRKEDEGPQHEVVIEPFWMGKHEVTWDEVDLWFFIDQQQRELRRKESGAQPSKRDKLFDALTLPSYHPIHDPTFEMGREGYPAICLTQLSAKIYCKWLSAKTGRYYRLPTEAEWEYACRAGTTTAYSFGDDPKDLDQYAWHFDNSDDRYHKVGTKKPNRWGLHDVHGNVSEWVLDQYRPDFYGTLAGKPVKGPLAVPAALFPRVVRGGCWDDDRDRLRSAARDASREAWQAEDPQIPKSLWLLTEVNSPGFRVVRPLRLPTEEECKRYEPVVEDFSGLAYRESSADVQEGVAVDFPGEDVKKKQP